MTPDEAAQFPVGCRVEIVHDDHRGSGEVIDHNLLLSGEIDVKVRDKHGVRTIWGSSTSLRLPLPAPEEIATAISNLDRILEDAW